LSRGVYPRRAGSFQELDKLCSIYNQLELFLWLNFRLVDSIIERQTAESLTLRTTEYITEALMRSEELQLNHCYVTRDKRIRKVHGISHKGKQKDLMEDYVALANEDLEDFESGIQRQISNSVA
jgi:hypothetical protein